MKIKILILVLLMTIIFVPNKLFAEKIDLSEYNSTGIKEVFEEEGIESDLSDYTENDKQVTIYLFRGHGCSYCGKLLNYINDTLLKEYKDYFKIVSFEVWYDSNNADLMKKVADYMGDDSSGVPYYIIGDETFIGYSESMNSKIERTIKSLYDSDERYDVFEQMEKNPNGKENNTSTIIFWNIIITIIGIAVVLYKTNKDKKEILNKLDILENTKTKTE